jgi:hypothetical protein
MLHDRILSDKVQQGQRQTQERRHQVSVDVSGHQVRRHAASITICHICGALPLPVAFRQRGEALSLVVALWAYLTAVLREARCTSSL